MDWDREFRITREYPVSRDALWNYWSTEQGLAKFFGAGRRVEFVVGGAFEIYFLLDNPPGARGSEECRILRLEPPQRLAFTWNAPPHLEHCRGQHTVVEVRLAAAGATQSHLTLVHQGFGFGGEWDACLAYFQKAWPAVLDRLADTIAKDRNS